MKKKDNEERITKTNSKDLKKLKSNTDWEKVDKLTDALIDRQIASDPDAAKALASEWFKKATWVKPTKKGISLHTVFTSYTGIGSAFFLPIYVKFLVQPPILSPGWPWLL